MWLTIFNIVVGCVAIGFAIFALVKVKRDEKKALALLEEAARISDETVVRAKHIEKQIENIIREMGGVPHEKI